MPAAGSFSVMKFDERGRQLGEVSRQLCEVGNVGMASAARLYAVGNAATAGIGTGIKKVMGGRHLPPTTPLTAADRPPPSVVSREKSADFPERPRRQNPTHGFSSERESRLERRWRSRQGRGPIRHVPTVAIGVAIKTAARAFLAKSHRIGRGDTRSTSAAPRGRQCFPIDRPGA